MMDISFVINLKNYFLNPYAIPPAIIASLVLYLAFFILFLEEKSSFNRSLTFLCLSTSLWLYGYSFLFSSLNQQTAVFWVRVHYVGFIFIPATVLHLSSVYTKRFSQERKYVFLTHIIALILIVLTWNENLLQGVREYYWGFFPDAGMLQSFLLLFVFSIPIIAILSLIRYHRQLSDDIEKKRTRILIIACLFILLSNVDILASYGISIYPFGYIAILCFVVCMLHARITHHNLMSKRYTKELEEQVEEKTKEISKVVDELRATQLRLIETGKISAIASLSAGILHQISQPITAIQGFAKFMRKEMSEDDQFYKPAKLMEEQSAYLKNMLEDLMDLIRHREIQKQNIDINLCIKKSTDLLTDELRIRRVNWDMRLADNLPQIYADAIHLQQVFMNIVVNAMQALITLPKGSERYLEIISQFDEVSNNVMVIFKDTGPGLSIEDKYQIFEPFFSTKTKGSGIGLALCKDLIAEHGGTIGVESDPNEGTKFIITFPPAESQETKS